MNRDRPIEEVITSWLADEARGTGPDHVLGATFEMTRVTPQTRVNARWRARFVNAKSLATVGGAAAVVVVGVLGAAMLVRPAGPTTPGGVGPAAVPSPSASPAPSDDVRPFPPENTEERLQPGRYRSRLFEAEIRLTVPAGWDAFDGETRAAVMSKLGTDEEAAIGFWRVSAVYEKPCQASTSRLPTAPRDSDHLLQVLSEMDGFEATAPSDVTFGGHDGKSLVLTGVEDGCVDPRLWVTNEGGCRCLATGDRTRHRITVVDVDGILVLVDAQDTRSVEGKAGTGVTVQAEMDAILDSVELLRPEG